MPDLPGMPSTTRCASCGFENTTTSLYCQDCGLRLAPLPSALAEPLSSAARAAATQVRSSPRILSVRRSNRVRSYLKTTILAVVVAALAALAIQIFRAPSDVPPTTAPLPAQVVTNVRAALQASAQRDAPFDAPWSGLGLNAYLAAVLQPVPSSGPLHMTFTRALLAPVAGGFSLFAEYDVFGLPLYSRIDYQLVSRGNGIGLTPVGAALGHLPLPAWSSPIIESMNGNLSQALASELDILREAKSVRITRQKASVYFGPSRP